MPPQSRLGDKSIVPSDSHGCPACPHTCVGPITSGSPNVNVNARAATRVGDTGTHASCCGPNTWKAVAGSATVFINGRAAHRKGDKDQHCGGGGNMIEGSHTDEWQKYVDLGFIKDTTPAPTKKVPHPKHAGISDTQSASGVAFAAVEQLYDDAKAKAKKEKRGPMTIQVIVQ